MSPRSPRRARFPLGHALAPLLLLACRSGRAPPPAPTAIPAPAPAHAISSAELPSPSASVARAPPARVSPTLADLEKRASSAPAWPSGPGVACGDARCKAGEFCCQGASQRCLPRSRVKACLDDRSVAMECDESSDCGKGQVCCYGIIYEKEAHHVSCKTPAVCEIPLGNPGGFPFPGRELCARGGACRDPKLGCVPDDGMPSGGRCLSKRGAVSCDGHADCPADRPWCLWDPGTRTAECIPRGPWNRQDGVYPCDGPEDCVDEPCCAGGPQSFCGLDCTEGFRMAVELCHKDADCLGPSETDGARRTVWKCEALDEGLPGLKQCVQSDVTPP